MELIGFHNFCWAGDWEGKSVGITKKTWCDAYMALDDNSPIVEAFCQLENKPFTLD